MKFCTTFISVMLAVLISACAGQPTNRPTIAPASSSVPATVPIVPTQSSPQPTPEQALQARIVAPTPVCNALEVTPALTEGPYYKQNPPERLSLINPANTTNRLVLTGFVITTSCKPIARARVDFWQADDQGVYDNTGYNMRGYQLTDDNGRYYLETVVPGLYPGRTRHIHVKVQAPNQPELTTQLFFPNEASNSSDSIFSSKLVMNIRDAGDFKVGAFNFVLNIK